MKKQATMIYLKKDNKILFLERHKKNDTVHKEGMHLALGGKVEKGESVEEGAKREVFEESGIKVNSLDLRAIIYFREWGKKGHDWIDYLFTSDDFSGEPKDGDEGNVLWVEKENIKNLNLYEGDKIFLDYLFKYNFFVAEFTYDNYDLKSHKLLKSF
ncbi:MAG TPA: 8-oxo-dGTP diphosphatase [Candidatus Sulfotelmatobacter sp.]|nr:8-oxo-dGTP diphosphatase [Candidatus Sulfotelmatobacter sp.]